MIDLCVLVLLEKGALFLGHPVLTARDILKPRNAKKNMHLVWKYYIYFLFTVLFKRKEEKKRENF